MFERSWQTALFAFALRGKAALIRSAKDPWDYLPRKRELRQALIGSLVNDWSASVPSLGLHIVNKYPLHEQDLDDTRIQHIH